MLYARLQRGESLDPNSRDKEVYLMKKTQKSIIAIRKTCKVKGTGLSHYVMTETKK